MTFKRRLAIGMGLFAIFAIGSYFLLAFLPFHILSVQHKPEQRPQKVYDYYIVLDEQTGHTLMYVPLVVSIGDDVISPDRERFRIVRIRENKAYARFLEKVQPNEEISPGYRARTSQP